MAWTNGGSAHWAASCASLEGDEKAFGALVITGIVALKDLSLAKRYQLVVLSLIVSLPFLLAITSFLLLLFSLPFAILFSLLVAPEGLFVSLGGVMAGLLLALKVLTLTFRRLFG